MISRTLNILASLNGSFVFAVSIYPRFFILLHGVIMLAMAVGGFATAAETPRTTALKSLYKHAGMHVHLASVYVTVIDETQLAWRGCGNAQNRSAVKAKIREHLSIDVLQHEFLDQLDQRISDEHLEQIISWARSDAGKSIHQAELDSIELNEASFESLLKTYKQSEIHSEERSARLQKMLAHTGAVYFLSAFNTELSALVSIASVCSDSKELLSVAQRQIKEDRNSEALYRSLMREDLLIHSAVVYRNISDEQLDALSTFASSDAGDAYFTALIKGTRSLLASKVDRLSEMFETKPEKAD